MEPGVQTLPTVPARPESAGTGEACLVRIYPTGPDVGRRYKLLEEPVIIGRGAGCEVQVDEHSVSRRHARIQSTGEEFFVYDLQSTNGTFVNEEPIETAGLNDGDYLRVGNCIFRFLAGGNVEADYHEEIYRMTIRDGLTDLHNKRYLIDFLDRELSRSARHGRHLTLLFFDIDRFKEVNDNFGHLCGDYALREMSSLVREGICKEELFARYGGEEFAIVLPETTCEKGAGVADRIRELVAGHSFVYENQPFRMTISIGLAATVGDPTMTPEELIRRADERLYEAKNKGRNCVVG
jgi:diguanylate cyclase (GGDEF)-like protein